MEGRWRKDKRLTKGGRKEGKMRDEERDEGKMEGERDYGEMERK